MKAVHHSLETVGKPSVASTCFECGAVGTESHISMCRLGGRPGNQKCTWIHHCLSFLYPDKQMITLAFYNSQNGERVAGSGRKAFTLPISNCFCSQD